MHGLGQADESWQIECTTGLERQASPGKWNSNLRIRPCNSDRSRESHGEPETCCRTVQCNNGRLGAIGDCESDTASPLLVLAEVILVKRGRRGNYWSLNLFIKSSLFLLANNPAKPTSRSAPAQKAFPVPVRTMARTRSSWLKSLKADSSSVSIFSLTALYFLGRLRATMTTFVAVGESAGTWDIEMSL